MGREPNQFAAMMGLLSISRGRADLVFFLARTLGIEDLFFFFWRTRPIIFFEGGGLVFLGGGVEGVNYSECSQEFG
jgi:hypothetical protein